MERNHFHLQMDCDTDYPYQITLKRKKFETWGNRFWIAVESFKVANDSILLILLVGKHSNKQVQKMEEILRSFEMERSMTKTENITIKRRDLVQKLLETEQHILCN